MNGIFYCPNCKEAALDATGGEYGDHAFRCVNDGCYVSIFIIDSQKVIRKDFKLTKKGKKSAEEDREKFREKKAFYKHIELLQQWLVKYVKLESKIHKLNNKYYHEKDGHPLVYEISKLSRELRKAESKIKRL